MVTVHSAMAPLGVSETALVPSVARAFKNFRIRSFRTFAIVSENGPAAGLADLLRPAGRRDHANFQRLDD